MAGVPVGIGLYLGLLQLLFALGWTVYAIFLPQLAASVGIPRSWVIWILIADQAIFAVMDTAMGVAADRVARGFGRVGPWVVAITALSCAAFLAMPQIATGGPVMQPVLLGLIALWAVTSSVLRAPPLMLLGKHAAAPAVPMLAALALLGPGIAGALGPYLTVLLRGADPRLPFLLASGALLLVTLGLAGVERRLAATPVAARRRALAGPPPPLAAPAAGFVIAAALLGLGFQVHASLNSAPLYLKLATPADLDLLMPVFWIGFNLALVPAGALTRRLGGLAVMGGAAVLGAGATGIAAAAGALPVLVAAQLVAGACWGAVTMSGVTAALALGDTGREGRLVGLLFSALAVATVARMALVAGGVPGDPAHAGTLVLTPPVAWALGGAGLLLLAATAGRRRQPAD